MYNKPKYFIKLITKLIFLVEDVKISILLGAAKIKVRLERDLMNVSKCEY